MTMHRLRNVAQILTSNVDKVIKTDEHPVRLCNYVDAYKNNFIHGDMPFKVGTATAAEIKRFRVQVDDVIITKDSETPDDIGVPSLVKSTARDLICGYHLSILRADRRRMFGPFLYWHLLSKKSQEDFRNAANGVTRFGLTIGGIKSVPINLPDLATQRRIADFLDRETARIDLLIEKKQRLVELVDEKRSALITAAVMGQLLVSDSGNRNFRFVAGGGWVTTHRLRDVAQILTSNVDKVVKIDEHPVRLCNYVDVYKNNFIHNDMPFKAGSATAAEIKKFRVQVDDVIITKDSETPDDIGVPSLVKSTARDLICGYHLSVLRADRRRMVGPFLYWHLLSKKSQEDFGNAANGVTRFGLTLGGIKNIPINLPDLETQRRIADFLDRETARFDAIKDRTDVSINRLQEYRSALITAAVTGQVDIAEQVKFDHRHNTNQEEMYA